MDSDFEFEEAIVQTPWIPDWLNKFSIPEYLPPEPGPVVPHPSETKQPALHCL